MELLKVLKTNGLKATPQRVAVLKELDKKTHPTMDEMYESIKKEHPSISLATVYKNVNILREHGIVIEINVPNGKMKYDYLSVPHIHMVCTECKKIVEFFDAELEKLQEDVALSNGFTLQSHNMLLYGVCKECQ